MKNKTWLVAVVFGIFLLETVYLSWMHWTGKLVWVHWLRLALPSGILLYLAWQRRQEMEQQMEWVTLSDSDHIQNRLFLVRKNARGRLITEVADGDKWPGFSGPDLLSKLELVEKAFAGEKVRFQMESGESVWHISLSPLSEKGQVKQVLGSAVDYTGNHDILTGLPNRKMLEKQLRRWTEPYSNQTVALMFIDLDRFKTINDTAGHRIGDLLLLEVTYRLNTSLGREALIARQGGDEFSVSVVNTGREEATTIASRLLEVLSKPYLIRGKEYALTASIGVSLYPYDAINMEQLFKNADTAMYLAKERGNRFQFYNHEMNETLSKQLELEAGLRKALENNEFELYYQPQFELKTGTMTGMEALIRWSHPEKGIIPPSEFISVAEETGWIVPIGEWVLRTACRQNSLWQRAGFRPVPVAVNISAIQFQHPHFFDSVFRILEETGLDPRYLELEMTESIFQNADTVITGMNRLKQIGVQLSIDDFGTGYSSLSYLKRFPVDTLKIDQSFVHDFLQHANGAALVKAIIALARSMRLKVVAEGIETNEQKRFLEIEQCYAGQGYLFAPPLPVDRFEHWLTIHTNEKESNKTF